MIGEEAESPDVCEDCGAALPYKVCRSNAGYYLGTECPVDGPYSRQSDYFRTREEADAALAFEQQTATRPTARTPGLQPGAFMWQDEDGGLRS